MELKVQEENGKRLDKYISENTEFSREQAVKLINDGLVLVNNKNVKASFKVQNEDVVLIKTDGIKKEEIMPEKIPLDIVYEDDDIIVLNKPSGLVVHPGSGNVDHTLVNGLLAHTDKLSNLNGAERPGIVHRLDKDTSGLMLVAKTNKAHEILAQDFKNKKIHRDYIALLEGVFPHPKAYIDAPLARDKDNFWKYKVMEGGKKSQTNLEVLKKYSKYTLVKLRLETGRTHQIRVHMAYIGYPVVNDPVYGKKKSTEFGQFLHSAYLEFEHPITHEKMHFTCELPKEFKEFLDNLEEQEEKDEVN